jgi:hypothetical protein
MTENQRLLICGALCLIVLVPVLLFVFKNIGLPYHGEGHIQIQVVDGYSSRPLKGAVVVIPELNKRYITDSEGKTPQITADILKDRQYDSILPQDWGRLTVLTYFDGYKTYALFYTAVWENKLREGPVIFMFPEGSAEEGQPFTVIEAPQAEWVNRLIEKYRP